MKQRAWPASHLSNCSVCQSKRVLSLHTDDFMLFFSSSPISPHHSVYLFFGEPCTICHLSLIIAFQHRYVYFLALLILKQQLFRWSQCACEGCTFCFMCIRNCIFWDMHQLLLLLHMCLTLISDQ